MGSYDYILEQYPHNVPVAAAAKALGKSPNWIHAGLKSGALPFGCCVEQDRCSFHIAPLALVRYLEGERMIPVRDLLDAIAERAAQIAVAEYAKKGGAA